MKIAILDDYQNAVAKLSCFDLLKDHEVIVLHTTEKNPKHLAAKIHDCEAIVLIRERTEITDALLSLLPNLKLISQTGKISNHLDLEACTKHRVLVTEGMGSPIAPAELTWLLIMNAVRQLPQALEAMKEGKWQTNIGTTIHGKTIGIWGYGKIGKRIAQYAKTFGAEVMVWGSENSRTEAVKDGFLRADSKEYFFQNCDIVTLHLRLNEATLGIVKAPDLSLMKPTSIIVNTARAELIEKNALLDSLKKGRPGFAALDVYEDEPIYDTAYELLKLPNVICSPHLGYVEQNGYELYFRIAFKNILNLAGGNPTNVANPELLK